MRCNVCYQPILIVRDKILCPECQNTFHRDHLAAWLLNIDYCPTCREMLSPQFLKELRPTSEAERRRLQEILWTLDNLTNTMANYERSRNMFKKNKYKEPLFPDGIPLGIVFLFFIAISFIVVVILLITTLF